MALRNLSIDEEITFDYESIESEIVAFDDCLCGSKNGRQQMHLQFQTI